MNWDVCGCLYTYDDERDITGRTDEIFFGNFNSFPAAFEAFCEKVKDPECTRVWIRVFKDKDDNVGELMTAYSNEWEDAIFNEDGI